MRRWTDSAAATAACLCLACAGWGQEAAESLELRLSNEQIACTVILEDGRLAGERLEALAGWAGRFGVGELTLACDADFAIDLMWTGWRAPGKISNADNLLQLTAKDFRYADHVLRTGDEHGSRLEITLKGIDTPFELQLAYRLEPDQFFLRRSGHPPSGGRTPLPALDPGASRPARGRTGDHQRRGLRPPCRPAYRAGRILCGPRVPGFDQPPGRRGRWRADRMRPGVRSEDRG